MADQPSTTWSKRLAGAAAVWGRHFVLALGNRLARLLVVIGILGALGWLVWMNALEPLRQPVLLPAGVSATNPEVNNEVLQSISSARVERSKYAPPSLAAFDPLLQPTTAPIPGSTP